MTGLQETGHYISEAASVIGYPSLLSSTNERENANPLLLAYLDSARDLSRMQTLQKELEKNPEIAQNEQMQQKAATLGLGLMWRLGKLQVCTIPLATHFIHALALTDILHLLFMIRSNALCDRFAELCS